MIVTKEQHGFLFHEYGFDTFPRYIGTPTQWKVSNIDEVINVLNSAKNGKEPIYVSHNSHQGSVVYYSQMAMDYDISLEAAMADLLKVIEYFDGYKIFPSYTGGKLQAFLKVNPFLSKIRNLNVHKFQKDIKDKLHLATLDLACAEPKRIVRCPLAYYVKILKDKSRLTTNRITIPLKIDDLTEKPSYIMELSENQDFTHIENKGMMYDIRKDIYEEKEKLTFNNNNSDNSNGVDWYMFPEPLFLQTIKNIINKKTILFDSLMTTNPNHATRLTACIAIKSYNNGKISVEEAKQIFARISEIAKWTNRNIEIQSKVIEDIYKRDYYLYSE